jgi:nudix-type nucleoside diphosphatase (YffH/AdpP family)
MTYTIQNTKRVYEGFLKIDVIEASFDAIDGSTLHKKFEVLEKGEAVAVLVEDIENDCFLMVKQFRLPTALHGNPWLLEIPAGIMEVDETPEEAAKREIMEELGYQINNLDYLFPFYATPGASTERVHLFYAQVKSSDKNEKGGGAVGEIEDIEIVAINKNRLLKMIGHELIDGKSIVALQHYFLNKTP